MSLESAKKAATLLATLDPSSAAELLKAVKPEQVTDIVTELACLRAGSRTQTPSTAEPAREFFVMLSKRQSAGTKDAFLTEVLQKALGQQRTKELLEKTGELVKARDPFGPARAAEATDLAHALDGESSSVAALVLSELPPRKSAELLALLDEKVRLEAVRCMAAGQEPSEDVRRRVGEMVMLRLRAPAVREEAVRGQQFRKVAVLLRGLPAELRDGMVQAMIQSDEETGKAVQQAMVTWEDIVDISDRSLQEALRGVDSKKLALALVGADGAVVDKIRRNMSDRAAAMLDEEASLLSAPKADEISGAREEFVSGLRELNAKNALSFDEG
ncbi:MAG TPA: FliG C-terminal domain-containing protein [Phycisphaerae bacterium]|nr:FliG C-terminal domain-containing protein [Phycisphaerae bacterium]